jgi:hypothetical protein
MGLAAGRLMFALLYWEIERDRPQLDFLFPRKNTQILSHPAGSLPPRIIYTYLDLAGGLVGQLSRVSAIRWARSWTCSDVPPWPCWPVSLSLWA